LQEDVFLIPENETTKPVPLRLVHPFFANVASPESAADEGYRAALASGAAHHTVKTAGISGRPARCLANRFTALVADVSVREIPAYPVA
jgi:nitronate monooxygenase